jgi:pimeloyl-ACP methyl ester carboxylesterase
MTPFEMSLDHITWRGWHRPGAGPRCLAVHGWLDNANSFLPLAEQLSDWDFLAVDLPGHGHSSYLPYPGTYTFIDSVHHLGNLMEAWGGPLVLMGHSLGGGLLSMLAGALPEPVTHLILLDALGPITTPAHEALELFRKSRQISARPYQRRHFATPEEALARLQHPPQAAAHLAARSLRREAQGYYFAFDPRVKHLSRSRLTEEQIQTFLQGIQCPVHVQSYSEGILPQFAPKEERLRCLRQVEWVDLPGSHHLHLHQPQVVAAAIRRFLP